MAKKSSPARLNLLSIVSFITLLLILVSVFVLSGSFSDLVTTINKSKASQAKPKVTESFMDPFKDGVVDADKWAVSKTEGASVVETTADNLRFNVAEGNAGGKVKAGTLTYKELFKNNGDFIARGVVYKPIVTGEGMGITALRFSSKGEDDDEAAVVRWQVTKDSSKITFLVNGADGKRMQTQQVEVKSNIAVLRLDRINKRYRAYYKVGRDLTADTNWIALGNEVDASLGNEGRISIATHNGGVDGKYPKVVGRLDQFHIAWEGDPSTKKSFSDAFANGNIGAAWKVSRTDGAQVYENKNDNLIMSMPSGVVNNKARHAILTRTQPVVPQGKDFALQATMYKPVVVGEGTGYAGLRFVSAGSVDDEAAVVRWVAGKDVSRMVFVIRAPDGTLAEQASVNVPVGLKAATLRLTRVGDSYRGWYRTGDADTDWVAIGTEKSTNFGANGTVSLIVSNAGAPNKNPRVIGRFDTVSGSVTK